MSRNLAALALGLGGVGQLAGRLGYARFAAATSVTGRGVTVLAGIALCTAALALRHHRQDCLSQLAWRWGWLAASTPSSWPPP